MRRQASFQRLKSQATVDDEPTTSSATPAKSASATPVPTEPDGAAASTTPVPQIKKKKKPTSGKNKLPLTFGAMPYNVTVLDEMNTIERRVLKNEAAERIRGTRLTLDEGCLLLLFIRYFAPVKRSFDRSEFSNILQDIFRMTNIMVIDRMFVYCDRNQDFFLDEKEWIVFMALFLRGTPVELREFAFNVYDTNQDGMLTRDEIYILLKFSMDSLDEDEFDQQECVRDLVEVGYKKLDHDRDGIVTPRDFVNAVTKDHLMMYALGRCVSDRHGKRLFYKILEQFRPLLADRPPEHY